MSKELKINIPEGYEIDKENSTFERIVFKKKSTYPKSWEEFCKNCRVVDPEYFVNSTSYISTTIANQPKDYNEDRNTCKTKEESFFALIDYGMNI